MDHPAIELIDVHTALGGSAVLRGVNFAARAGRITVVLGPSGVGKTTCLRHVVGLLVPDEGDVLIEGRSRLRMRKPARLALSRRFGVLLQGSGLYGSALWDSMTVEENLRHQLRAQRPDLSEAALARHCAERLREVGLADSAALMPAALSGGMRRRVGLARALVADPDFAVLDSLELGVDPVRLAGLCRMIAGHQTRTGATYLIATQKIDVARRLADDVIVLWAGRVLAEGPAEEVLSSARPEIEQLVRGSEEGPLGFAGEGPLAAEGQPADALPRSHPPHAEHGFEIPLPLAAVVTLAAITASAVWLGGGHPFELAVVVGIWLVTVALLALRHRQATLRRRRALRRRRRAESRAARAELSPPDESRSSG
jgi:phospholipid/cholesterol/gamma-HCH transport system ATP-binding protein